MNLVTRQVYGNKKGNDYVSYSTTDADALAYISAAALTDTNAINSAHYIFSQLKKWNLYNKIQAMYLFKGIAAGAHKFNAKNPIDTNAAFRLNFTGTSTFSDLGFQLNGSGYANTNFIPSAVQSSNNQGITIVCGTNNAAFSTNVYDLGCYQSNSQCSILTVKGNSNIYRGGLNNFDGMYRAGVNESRGIFTLTRTGTTQKFYRNNLLIGNDVASGSLPTIQICIGGLNQNGSYNGNSNQRMQIVMFHEGLSTAEIDSLYKIIDTAENMAGRKTW